MRLVICVSSTILLSGCSWLGIGGNSQHSQSAHQAQNQQTGGRYVQNNARQGRQAYANQNQNGQYGQQRLGPCEISSPTQSIPRGCRPEQVTISTQGYGAQSAQTGGYTTGGYGSHAKSAYGVAAGTGTAKTVKTRRPKLRGALSFGFEPSATGDLLSPGLINGLYDATNFEEARVSPNTLDGVQTTTTYQGVVNQIEEPSVSFGDVYTAPFRIAVGGEYIFSEKTTAFANAGYTYAEGKRAGGQRFIGNLEEEVSEQTFAGGAAVGAPLVNTTFIPNQELANIRYDFTDYKRIDLEAGVRHYFNPIFKDQFKNPVTPFVSVSGGATYLGDINVNIDQDQRFLEAGFNAAPGDTATFFDVPNDTQLELSGSQWVGTGSLLVGAEFQLTPRTALAFETGVRYEGGRNRTLGGETNDNFSVPLTVRTSYNF